MAQVYTDLTVRLDEMYANGDFSHFTPKVTPAAKEVRAASARMINERGGFYLSQTEIPMNFASDNFGSNAGADFGDAGKNAYLKQVVTALKRMSSVKWQDEVAVQSKPELLQKTGKTVNEKLQLIAGHMTAYAFHWSRELWGDRTNELGRVSAVDDTAKTITCANAGNNFGVYNFAKGQNIMIYSSGGTLRTGGSAFITITGVSTTNRVLSYAATTAHPATQTMMSSVVAGDIIYPSQGTVTLKDKALAGFRYLAGVSGAFQGVSDRTTEPFLSGTYLAAGGASISAAFLRKMKSDQKYRTWGQRIENGKFYASAQFDAYEATELGKQSMAQDGSTLRKGYRKLYFDDSPFMEDLFIPRDAVAYADLSQIDRFSLREYGPVRDESGYELAVPSTSGGTYQDNLMIRFRGYEQLGCEVPAMLGVYADGLSTAGVSVGYSS